MEEHEIALMADEGVDRALVHGAQSGAGFVESRDLLIWRKRLPSGPAESHHLVQDAGAFERQRNSGQRSHRPFILAQARRLVASVLNRTLQEAKKGTEGRGNAESLHHRERKPPISPTGRRNGTHHAARCRTEARHKRWIASAAARSPETPLLQNLSGQMLYWPLPLLIGVAQR